MVYRKYSKNYRPRTSAPARRGRRKRPTRASRRPRARQNTSLVNVSRTRFQTPKNPFPLRLHTKLNYATNMDLTAGALDTAGTQQAFRLTSIWDPNSTGVGTTVCGHALWAQVYNKYIVKGVRVIAKFANPSQDGTHAVLSVNQKTSTTASPLTNLQQLNKCWVKHVSNTGSQQTVISKYFKPWDLMDITKNEYLSNRSTYGAIMASNPASSPVVYLNVVNDMYAAPTINLSMRIIYYVEMADRDQLTQT